MLRQRLSLFVFAAVIPLVLILTLYQVQAIEVPFPTKHNVTTGAFDGASSVYAADLDGDADLDVLGAAWNGNAIAWWENTAGDGTAWTKHAVDTAFEAPYSVFAADLDGDTDLDVLASALNTNEIAWWENTAGDGTAWTKHLLDSLFEGATSVYAADIDGDADLDVLGTALIANDVAWWENTAGDGSAWTKQVIDGVFNGAYAVFAADLDGDNDLDVTAAALLANDVAWWENSAGDGSAWTKHAVDNAFNGARSVFAADVDGDGDDDLLGAARFAGEIAWWENTAGDGTAWTKHTVSAAFAGAMSVYAADIDRDGDLDLLGAGMNANDITWWENMAGNGSAWTEHVVDGAFGGAHAVFAADVDGDHDLDVLGAAFNDDAIAWWEATPATLVIAKTVTPVTAVPGQAVTYTLSFHNYSAGIGTNIVITDVIPSVLTAPGFTSNVPVTPTNGTAFVWDVGTVGPGAGGVITLTGIINGNTAAGTVFTNTAVIAGVISGTISSFSAQAAVTVHALNHAPTVSDFNKTIFQDNVLLFSRADFETHFDDADGDGLDRVQVTSLPLSGMLKLNGTAVALNQEIAAADLDKLSFVPDAGWNGSTSFDWSGSDGVLYAAVEARASLTVLPPPQVFVYLPAAMRSP